MCRVATVDSSVDIAAVEIELKQGNRGDIARLARRLAREVLITVGPAPRPNAATPCLTGQSTLQCLQKKSRWLLPRQQPTLLLSSAFPACVRSPSTNSRCDSGIGGGSPDACRAAPPARGALAI
jgi:hypothetical protein